MIMNCLHRVEAPTTNYLRDSAPNMKKCKVVQGFPVYEERNKEDCNVVDNFIP